MSPVKSNTPKFGLFKSADEVRNYTRTYSNWHRWGESDELGTLNLITPNKRRQAGTLIQAGSTVSLSRPIETTPHRGNPRPVLHYVTTAEKGQGAGVARDFVGVVCHGPSHTHVDALCHVWDTDGMLYNGYIASSAVTTTGINRGGLDGWSGGIVTRAFLFDVPAFRSEPYVSLDAPVTAMELEQMRAAKGIELEPGDAVLIYSGRERWDQEQPVWSSETARPGLDVSCLQFLRYYDCSVLVWDMMDVHPSPFGLPYGVHLAIPSFGLVLVDNARLDRLAAECARLDRLDVLLMIGPLYLRGGTGSLVNPIAAL